MLLSGDTSAVWSFLLLCVCWQQDLGENQALGSVRQPDTLRLQMGVLLARSENQILVLETLLKRLVQVCVHTQDKRLAKELKLMDFTRLVRVHFPCRLVFLHLVLVGLALGCLAAECFPHGSLPGGPVKGYTDAECVRLTILTLDGTLLHLFRRQCCVVRNLRLVRVTLRSSCSKNVLEHDAGEEDWRRAYPHAANADPRRWNAWAISCRVLPDGPAQQRGEHCHEHAEWSTQA